MASKDLNGAQVGMTPRAGVNDPRPNNVRGRNEFPQTHKHLTTDRYGEFSPFFWCKCERGDVQNLHAVHDLHTFTLQSPMVCDVELQKSFIKIPMQAIYPRNWEKIMTIPTQGDDVPSDIRALLDVRSLVENLVTYFNTNISSDSLAVKSIFVLESICSHGSLFERFNYHLNYIFKYDTAQMSFDKWFDTVFAPEVIDFGENNPLIDDLGQNVVQYFVKSSDSQVSSTSVRYVSPRRFLELIRSNHLQFDSSWEQFGTSLLPLEVVSGYDSRSEDSSNDKFINIEPIIAYQLACAQFATNDFVDFIYSAQLYRDNMQSLLNYDSTSLDSFQVGGSFLYNGVSYLYDIFSGYNLSLVVNYLSLKTNPIFDFLLNLFSYQNSLRYGDYFTGAKPQPLAVGEYSAQVNNNEVSAIDVTRSIQMQRLLNRVNMVGRKLGDYLSGIFGGSIPPAPKDVPIFLAHQKFGIKGFETANTGAAQFDEDTPNTITSHLRTDDNRHAFEIQIDEPCYIIGMTSYSTPRIYSKTLDRFAFHHDRYDDFIPEMQYIGDQDIKLVELDSSSNVHVPYAYTLRYMEYKQRYGYASCGFVENLPSWAFITDNSDGNPVESNISPEYIRSSPSEFDRFYKSLTGFSLGSYFHFIIAHTNITSPTRMMEYTPEILK